MVAKATANDVESLMTMGERDPHRVNLQ